MSNFAKADADQALALGIQMLKRLAPAWRIGGVVAFLVSNDARWISGDTVRSMARSKF